MHTLSLKRNSERAPEIPILDAKFGCRFEPQQSFQLLDDGIRVLEDKATDDQSSTWRLLVRSFSTIGRRLRFSGEDKSFFSSAASLARI